MMVVGGKYIYMKINKFNIKQIKEYSEENDLSSINSTMLIILAKLCNEYLNTLEEEGIMIHSISREGNDRVNKNKIIDSIIPTFSMISKILKDNNLVLSKKTNEEEKDEFQILINNLIEKR